MPNMSYCRFYQTAEDLKDCCDNMDESLEGEEALARLRLINLCVRIAGSYGDEVGAIGEIQASHPAFRDAVLRLRGAVLRLRDEIVED